MIRKYFLPLLLLLNTLLFSSFAIAGEDLPRLYIDSQPKGAKVIIWNIQPSFTQGMTLLPGDYDIQVQKNGYQAYRKTIHIENSQRLKVVLQPKSYPFRIALSGVPANKAKIIIWNIKAKFKQGMSLPSGEYKLQIQAQGYKTYSKVVKIAGKALNLKVKMQPIVTYTAESVESSDVGDAGYPLYVTPKDARIKIINIKPRFKQGMHLLPGKYHLEIKYKNFDTIAPWIEIKDGAVYIELLTQTHANVKTAKSVSTNVAIEDNQADRSDVPPGYYRLNITTVPENARIHIFNIQKVYTKGMALKPGRYLLHISAPNVPVHKKWIEIVDQDIDLYMEL